ncbi:SUKH-3 domain-containing protein [Micromonospora sp. LOL_023]|uniref:SUKH-3 domain-containing protein n=1 Tax=Micromonospora sp. LOL_023 TaxID=3345418 RepID=UPI003A86D0B5
MIGRDEARTLAEGWAAAHGGGPDPQIGLHEFDQGYVAWLVPSDPGADSAAAGPPGSSGTPRIVIDRESGEVSEWPPLPVPVVAQRYATERAADRRFPPDVRHVLETAGWFPGRDVSAMVDNWSTRWADELSGLVMSAAARAALVEFGGLTFPQFGADGTADAGFPTFIHPVRSGLVTEEARVFIDEHDHQVFPFGGNSDGPSELVVDAEGRFVMLHWAGYRFIDAGVDETLIRLIRGGPFPPLRPDKW